MKVKALKHSKQRDSILRVLSNTTTHPTADWIYAQVKEEVPNISLGTIYRNLAQLTENHMVLKLTIGDGLDHYDATITPHYHFCCSQCHQIYDLPAKNYHHLNRMTADTSSHQVDRHLLVFYGTCCECLKKNNKS